MKKICENCDYYRRQGTDGKSGMCMAHPPVVMLDTHGNAQAWHRPDVEAGDWCSEWASEPVELSEVRI